MCEENHTCHHGHCHYGRCLVISGYHFFFLEYLNTFWLIRIIAYLTIYLPYKNYNYFVDIDFFLLVFSEPCRVSWNSFYIILSQILPIIIIFKKENLPEWEMAQKFRQHEKLNFFIQLHWFAYIKTIWYYVTLKNSFSHKKNIV